MRRISDIWAEPFFESVASGFDAAIIEKYARGKCHALALALHRRQQWPIMALGIVVNLGMLVRASVTPSLPSGRNYFGPLRFEEDCLIFHFCVRHPDRGMVDIYGHHHIAQIQHHFTISENERVLALECSAEMLEEFTKLHEENWDPLLPDDLAIADDLAAQLVKTIAAPAAPIACRR